MRIVRVGLLRTFGMLINSIKAGLAAGICLALCGCATPAQLPTAALGPLDNAGARTLSLVPPAESAIPESDTEGPTPAGFISFCIRNISQCDTTAGPSKIVLTADAWATLQQVNNRVNDSIEPEDDLTHYGVAEFWTIPTDGRGDCDDYVVTKRKALIDSGLPQSVLRIAIVDTASGVRHAVLTVSTDKGDYVLDSLTPKIIPWSQTEYVWLERQDPSRPWGWLALGAGTNDNLFGQRTAASAPVARPVGSTAVEQLPTQKTALEYQSPH